ncbi:MAG: PAS domain S-box-containing protein, partial [Gammaproteobacteria bacterium]
SAVDKTGAVDGAPSSNDPFDPLAALSRDELYARINGLSAELAVLQATAFPTSDENSTSEAGAVLTETPPPSKDPHAQRHAQFTAVAADWFWESDINGCLTYLSDRYEEVLACPPEKMLGHNRHKNLARLGAYAPAQADNDASVARNEAFDNFEFFIGTSNEEERAFRLRGRPWFDEHRAFAGYRGSGVEFTAERNAQRACQRSEALLKAVVDNTQNLVFLKDTEGRYVLTNREFERCLGFSPGQALGKTSEELFPALTAATIQFHDDEIVRTGELSWSEYSMTEAPGMPTLLAVKFPIWSDEQTLFGLGGVGTDITRQKAIEGELRQSELRFRAIAQATPHPVCIAQRNDGQVMYANESLVRVLGLVDDPRTCYATTFFLDPDHFHALVDQAVTSETYQVGDVLEMRHANGEAFWAVTTTVALVFEDELAVLISIVDVTETMASERALQEQTSLFEAIFDHVPDAVIFTDTALRVRMVNHGVNTCFGYDATELIGHSASRLFPNASDEDVIRTLRAGDESGQHRTGQLCRRDKTIFDAEFSSAVVRDGADEVVGFVAFVQDVTDRKLAEREHKELEAQLRQSQKLQAIGELTGGIAHDFNNILASVLGYTQLARQFCVSDPKEKLATYLDEVLKAGNRARELVAQMVAFSRSEPGNVQTIDLEPLAREALRLMRSTIPASILIETQFAQSAPWATIDPGQLHQILMNLCINARDAMGGRGHLTVAIRTEYFHQQLCSSCGQRFDGEMLVLDVSDTGTGVSPEVVSRMFEPFFTTKDVGEGSGMGLAMVHGIVHGRQGHVVVASHLGQGTSVRLLFRPEVASAGIAGLPLSRGRDNLALQVTGNIVIVDDEATIVNLLREFLLHAGFEVRCFTDSLSALDMLANDLSWADLLLTDQTMPGMTGNELAVAARVNRPDLPVIVCSGHREGLHDVGTPVMRSVAFLQKPIDHKILLGKLQELLLETHPVNSAADT